MKSVTRIAVLAFVVLFLQGCGTGGKLLSEVEPVYEENFELEYYGENKSKAKYAMRRAFENLNYNKVQERGDKMEFEWKSPKFFRWFLNKYQRTYVTVNFESDHANVKIRQNGRWKHGTMRKTQDTFNSIKKEYRSNL